MARYTVERSLNVPVETAFDVIVAADVLPYVLRRWGPIPGVAGTRDEAGPWDTPGSSRVVVLEDGRTVRETVLAWQRPSHFAYRVAGFEGAAGRFVDHAVGEWWFEPRGRDGAWFRWRYTFRGRGWWTAPALAVFARTAWAGYMEQCADLCVARALEAAATA